MNPCSHSIHSTLTALLYMTTDSTQWKDFESLLLNEFRSILSNFKCIESSLTSDTRKDFRGLVKFILKDRASFREVVLKEFSGLGLGIDDCSGPSYDFDTETFIKSLPDNLPSFSPEFSKFPLILDHFSPCLIPSLMEICEKYWNNRYPSIKESFIIPFIASSTFNVPPTPKLVNLLRRRILKGKLIPYDCTISLASKLQINPSDFREGYLDRQLTTLKEIISNNLLAESELSCVLKQSGCHCD